MKWPRPKWPRFTWIREHWMQIALGAVAVVALVSLALNIVLLARSGDTADRLDNATVRLAVAEEMLTKQDDRLDGVESATGVIVSRALGLQQLLTDLTPQVDQALAETITQLATFEGSTITFTVDLDEELPIAMSVPFQRTIEIPISTSIPIDETIRTTIEIDGPFGIDIPLTITVPLALNVPVDLIIPFTIDETMEVNTSVTIDLEFPLSISVADSGLADLTRQLRSGLEMVREVIADLT